MIAVKALQDDSGHWYVVPNDLSEKFSELLEDDSYEAESEFIDLFSKYRTHGDLNNIQLFAEL